MRPSDFQHKELQRVTMIELQAKVAELEDKNENLTSQNSELILTPKRNQCPIGVHISFSSLYG